MSNLKKRKEEYIPTTIGENWCYENGYKQGRTEERTKTIDKFVKSLFANEVIDKSVVRRVAEQMKE